MTLILTDTQEAVLTAVFADANGIDIAPDLADPLAPQSIWTEDTKGTVVKLVPGGAGAELTCVVQGVAPGTANVTCADRGTGKSATLQVAVHASGISQVTISAATPVRQSSGPAAEPAPAATPTSTPGPTPTP